MALEDYEDVPARGMLCDDIHMYTFERVYNIPPEATSLVPSRGDVLTLKTGDPASDLEGGNNCLKCRVANVMYGQQRSGASKRLRLTVVLPIAFSTESATTYQELRGSRREGDDIARKQATGIGVSTDGANGPSIGDLYADDTGLGVLGRYCNNISTDRATIPGLYLITATYDFARNTRIASHSWGDMFRYEYTIAAGADPPARGDLATGESGILGRRITSVACVEQSASTPTRVIVEVAQPVTFTGATGDTYRELRGSRGERGSTTRRYGYTIGVSSDGTGGPADGDFFPGDSGLLGRRCGLPDVDRETIPGLYLIRATYTAFVAVSGTTGSLIEVRGPHRVRRRGLNSYHAIRTFLCAHDNAMTQQAALYGQMFPGLPSGANSKCYDPRIEWNPDGLDGLAMITAVYSPPGAEILPAGKARLYMSMKGQRVRRLRDDSGNIIEGVVSGFNGANSWRLVAGNNETFESRIAYKIVGYYNRSEIPELERLAQENHGLLNSRRFKRPNANRGTLQFMGMEIDQAYTDAQVPVAFHLDFLRTGWATTCTSRAFGWSVATVSGRGVLMNHSGQHVDDGGDLYEVADVTRTVGSYGDLNFIRKLEIVD